MVSRATSWTDTTEILAYTGANRIKAIEVQMDPAATADAWVQLFDNANPTPGATAPDVQVLVPRPSRLGKQRLKILLGGLRFTTALSWFVSTAASGGTAAVSTSKPNSVQIFFDEA